jgi:maltooligosyltrehalose trehalohydrolase
MKKERTKGRTYSQGAELVGSGVSFRTWASDKSKVELVLMDDSGAPLQALPMVKDAEGYYQVETSEASAGMLYQYRLDGRLLPDPASRFQPLGVHGPSQIVDPSNFRWTDKGWRRPKIRDWFIYELHVGTFTPQGAYLAIIDHFEHLIRLGITVIELMPIADFPGKRNWGYDGVTLYAPCHSYGTPDDLRHFINAAHQAGLAVVLDAVYNHLGPDGNYLGDYSTNYFNAKHHTPWGAAFNFDAADSGMVRRLFIENAIYWLEEFRFDGFRLDATQAIPDDSAKHLIQEITEETQKRGCWIICEDPRNERLIVTPREKGGYGCDAVWADDFHHVVRVQMTGEAEGYLGYFKGTAGELLRTMREGWLFTGQVQKDGIPRGTPGADIQPTHFVHCISNHDQVGNRAFGDRLHQVVSPEAYRAASALLLLSPYTPMLFMGQEWGCSSPFCYFTDHEPALGHNVTEGRRKEFKQFSAFRDAKSRKKIPDPQAEETFLKSRLAWQDLANPENVKLLRLYQDVIEFRRTKLTERDRGAWEIELVAPFTFALRYHRILGGASLLALIQLVATQTIVGAEIPILRPRERANWQFAISSNQPIYGGQQPGLYDPNKKEFSLIQPETIVFLEAGES